MAPPTAGPVRDRADRCPGVLRPWLADDGALLRIRLVGGRLRRDQLAGLGALAARHGDGNLHLTSRANLQVRGVPVPAAPAVAEEVAALGLLPSPAHDRARNVMVSPLTGRAGGRADLRPVADALDAALVADAALAGLPGRFSFCLDDRGDLPHPEADLGLLALDAGSARLWAGGLAGDLVTLDEAAAELVALARRFLALRGEGDTAAWHVVELPGGGADLGPFRSGAEAGATTAPPPPGPVVQDDGRHAEHLPVPDGTLTPALLARVLDLAAGEVVVTPWRSLLLPDLETAP